MLRFRRKTDFVNRVRLYFKGWWERHIVADYPYEGKL